MKVIVIGDTHGRDKWKEIVTNKHDEIVFVGDYFDSWDIDPETQIRNFQEILRFKETHNKPVHLLIGNHDLYYIGGERGSGYQEKNALVFRELLWKADLKMAVEYSDIGGRTLITHAGVTNTWLSMWTPNNVEFLSIGGLINDVWNYRGAKAFNFYERARDPYGDDIYQSPVWVRPKSLLADKPKGINQIVGHTRHTEIEQVNGVTFIDVLDSPHADPNYYELELL